MNLTADNTAIVIDSTADFPDAQERFSNWRVVPLYVNFGTESFKDGVDLTAAEFYERLRTTPELPTTSQPTPGDFLAAYEELGAYERILSLHIASNLSGTFQSAGTAAAQLGDARVRTIDSESASVAISMLALAIQRRLERGTTDEEIDALDTHTRDEPSLRVGIAHSDAPERMVELEKMVRYRRPRAQIEMETMLGAVIGAHAGPGTVGFFWFTDQA